MEAVKKNKNRHMAAESSFPAFAPLITFNIRLYLLGTAGRLCIKYMKSAKSGKKNVMPYFH